MGNRELPKQGKFDIFRNFAIFNLAGFIGFILGTAAFTASMLVFPNPTFAWLFANGVGGISHFSANYIMQRQKKEKIVKNFIVFNATGIIGFIVSTVAFAATIIYIQHPTAAWLIGSTPGALAHFILNDKAINLNLKLNTNLFKRKTSTANPHTKPAPKRQNY